jgi:hypothetical protein
MYMHDNGMHAKVMVLSIATFVPSPEEGRRYHWLWRVLTALGAFTTGGGTIPH